MTTTFAIKIFFELTAILLFLYGLYHEDRLIAFEDRVLASLRGTRKTQQKTTARKQAARATVAYTEDEIFAAREQRAMEAAAARKAAARMKSGNQAASAEIKSFPASARKNSHVA